MPAGLITAYIVTAHTALLKDSGVGGDLCCSPAPSLPAGGQTQLAAGEPVCAEPPLESSPRSELSCRGQVARRAPWKHRWEQGRVGHTCPVETEQRLDPNRHGDPEGSRKGGAGQKQQAEARVRPPGGSRARK